MSKSDRRMYRMYTVRRALVALFVAVGLGAWPSTGAGQTLAGRLMDEIDDRPIALGLVILTTVQGDSVAATLTSEDGDFRLQADAPGSFLLTAAALGYRERTAGVFELGEDGRMSVEFRVERQPVTLEGLIVHAGSYEREPSLVRNGFYRRMQRGMGHFLSPGDLEESQAIVTPDLFYGLPGVRVVPGTGIGEDRVTVRGAGGRYCTPAIFLDGVRVEAAGESLDAMVPLEVISAVEVHGGIAGVPIEYGGLTDCGVLLFWTKR